VVPRFRKSATHGSKESIVNTRVFGGKNELIIAAQNIKGNTIHTKNLLASMAPPGPVPLTQGSTSSRNLHRPARRQAPKDEAERFIRARRCEGWSSHFDVAE
jgi:hypothetical protein